MNEELGTRIRLIRKQLGLNMEEFGKLFSPNASKGVVSNWENNYNLPNSARIARIAELGGISVDELLHGSKAELKSKITQYIDEIMKIEIKEMHSQKYKELYDLKFRNETIEFLLNRYNFEGLSDTGIKQYTKEILDKYLDKVIYERKYKPHCNKSAIHLISDRLDDILKEHINSYFRDENIAINHYHHYLENDEIKANLSYELYTELCNIIDKTRNEINALIASYPDDN